MAEKTKNYYPESQKKYKASLTDEEKAEKNRRDKFVRARSFISKELYTSEELEELYQLILEHRQQK
jgi:hypothetical protein